MPRAGKNRWVIAILVAACVVASAWILPNAVVALWPGMRHSLGVQVSARMIASEAMGGKAAARVFVVGPDHHGLSCYAWCYSEIDGGTAYDLVRGTLTLGASGISVADIEYYFASEDEDYPFWAYLASSLNRERTASELMREVRGR